MHHSRRTCTLVSLLLVALSVSCRRPPVAETADVGSSGSEQLLFAEQSVKFCWQRPAQPRNTRVQVLLDSSGSMIGFKQSVPLLVNWIQHSISQLQTSTINMESARLCQFNERLPQGINGCTEFGKQLAHYEPHSNTNLHVALRSAKDFGLTLILTDGVAATGGKRSGDCANGVDAACIARSLHEVVKTPGSQPEGVDWGVWVMPVAATYDGTFYTEEVIAPTDFKSDVTQNRVLDETGVQPKIENPQTGSDGLLNFKYRGPRMMLLIVIARWSDLGRNTVQALWERMTSLNIARVDKTKDLAALNNGIASFPPVEVYPGFLERLEWKKLQASDEPGDTSGTMDVYFVADKQRIESSCPKDAPGTAVHHLEGEALTADQISGCVGIYVVPPFTFGLYPEQPLDQEPLTQFVSSYEQETGSIAKLRLNLACNMSTPRPCITDQVAAQWRGSMQYGKAADSLASPDAEHHVPRAIKQITAQSLSLEPHRIFGFASTLEAFYREIAADERSVVLANLNFCHR